MCNATKESSVCQGFSWSLNRVRINVGSVRVTVSIVIKVIVPSAGRVSQVTKWHLTVRIACIRKGAGIAGICASSVRLTSKTGVRSADSALQPHSWYKGSVCTTATRAKAFSTGRIKGMTVRNAVQIVNLGSVIRRSVSERNVN